MENSPKKNPTENRIGGLLSCEELLAVQSCAAGEGTRHHLQLLGWEDTFFSSDTSEEGFVNLQKGLPPLYIENLPPIGGRKHFNKRSQKIRKELQKEGVAGVTICTPFIMQRCSLFGAWLLQENWLQYHGTLRLEGQKVPLHFWCKEGRIILPKVKLRSQAQYQACVNAGLI